METSSYVEGDGDETVGVATHLDRNVYVVGVFQGSFEEAGEVTEALANRRRRGFQSEFDEVEKLRIASRVEGWVAARAVEVDDGSGPFVLVSADVADDPGAATWCWRIRDGVVAAVDGAVELDGARVEPVRRTVEHTAFSPGTGDSSDTAYAAAYLLQLLGVDGSGPRIAATGDLDPSWRVSKVAAVSEKLYAAQRAGCDHMLVPARSQVVAGPHGGLAVWWTASLDEVLSAVLDLHAEPGRSTLRPQPRVFRWSLFEVRSALYLASIPALTVGMLFSLRRLAAVGALGALAMMAEELARKALGWWTRPPSSGTVLLDDVAWVDADGELRTGDDDRD